MNKSPKIIGVIQARDEWPLVTLSISHALMHHVDEVFILNHAGGDASFQKIIKALDLWRGRVHLFNLYDERYWQEASSSVLVELCQSVSPDWIYFFDADEFLLTQDCVPLRQILNGVDAKCSVIRYEFQNWISTDDFDPAHLDHYRNLVWRALPDLSRNLYTQTVVDEIWQGNLNFFDVPSDSKVIFRNDCGFWPCAGAHNVQGNTVVETFQIDSETLRAVHLPFLSRDRLQLKAKQGEALIQSGFEARHGWQNQLIYRFWKEGLLDQFWKSHSIGPRQTSCGRKLPSFVIDDGLARAIEPVLSLLEEGFGSGVPYIKSDPVPMEPQDTQIPLRTAIRSARKFQLLAESMRIERNALAHKLSGLTNLYNNLIRERNVLMNERDTLRDIIAKERDAFEVERNAIEKCI